MWRLLLKPDLHFFEEYVRGAIVVETDLTDFLRDMHATRQGHRQRRARKQLPVSRRDRSESQQNASHHYDVGNEFYSLWLDEQLLYTCAYFETEGLSLEAAQVAKMDHVCRKLQLKPGEEVIEAGCGWGALALHMARHYGTRVRAYNVSREQVRYARERARQEGLDDRVEFVQEDWRDISGYCDAVVSVGMLEHVGPKNYVQLGRVLQNCLRPQGRGLIHSIGQSDPSPLNPWIKSRIFPGAQPPTLKQMMDIFEPVGLTVLDVENLRPHYAETLRHWWERFELAEDQILEMFDEEFVQTWRMYLAASQTAFEQGELELYQVVFAPTARETFPRTRAEVYRHLIETSPSSPPDGMPFA